MCERERESVCMCVCVCARAHARVCACVYALRIVSMDKVFALYKYFVII